MLVDVERLKNTYIVYTEIHEDNKVERWYFAAYENKDKANEVALSEKNEYPVYHCVCKLTAANELNINNLPLSFVWFLSDLKDGLC